MQAKLAFVPNIEYDFIFYTLDSGPVCISTKTTLRERYKQADLEAVALKYVHRKAKSYFINISEDENRSLQHKIEKGDLMGLDGSICAFDPEFDEFMADLKKRSLAVAPKVRVVSSEIVILGESVKRLPNS